MLPVNWVGRGILRRYDLSQRSRQEYPAVLYGAVDDPPEYPSSYFSPAVST
jgi:hypothetical protein